MRLSKWYFGITWTALVAGVVLPMLPLIAMTWVGSTDFLTALAWMAVGFSLAGYVCSLARERGKSPLLMMSGLVTGVCAFLAWAWSLGLAPRSGNELAGLWFGTALTGWTALMMFVGVHLMIPSRAAWIGWLRSATIALASILTAFLVIMICKFPSVDQNGTWQESREFVDLAARCGGVLGILVGAGTAVIVIANLLPRVSRDEVPMGERLQFGIVCPRCAVRQRIMTDGAECCSCGLRIKVTPT